LNSTGAIGLDLLTDPNRVIFAKSVIRSDGVYVAGPLTLRECQLGGGECKSTVEKAFVAARPIRSQDHQLLIDDTIFPVWGSVEALINWEALVERSGVFERFEEQSNGFRLTREDRVVNSETGEENIETVVLAETDDYYSGAYNRIVSTTLDTTDDLWQMSIVYTTSSNWLGWGMAVTIALSLVVAALVFMIVLERYKLGDMRRRYFKDVAQPQKLRLRLFLDDHLNETKTLAAAELLDQKPIADFYPAVTVFFADIIGFESFASEREPSQVFKLLQTVFYHFDRVGLKRQVFKVDTLGDTYMAVTGLPNSQPDHAVRMAKYAQECLIVFDNLTRELEKDLGPATGSLMLRIGISSGPATAGILLGQSNSRFHLFGKCTTKSVASDHRSTTTSHASHLTCLSSPLLGVRRIYR
jgi:class 3 adenylate cyclase